MEQMITSTSNTYIKHLKKLQTSARYRSEKGTFVLEGQRQVADAISYGIVPEVVIISEKYNGKINAEKVFKVTEKVAQYISDTTTPQGIMAEIKMPVWDAKKLSPETSPFLFFSDGVSDPGNLGTIIRTLEAAGASGIILGKGTVDLFNPKTVRSTMSSLFNLPVYMAENSENAINTLKKKGYKIAGTRMENALCYTEADLTMPTVAVLGNEARGISEEILNICDEFIKIPIEGKIESLNVAVAAAIVAYEAHRQRNK